jgi:hypothetical protein
LSSICSIGQVYNFNLRINLLDYLLITIKVTILSREASSNVGLCVHYSFEGFVVGTPSKVAMHPGTIVEVNHLFSNLPVRKKVRILFYVVFVIPIFYFFFLFYFLFNCSI